MAERRIQHAVLRYKTEDGRTELAFRGSVVDIPDVDGQLERFESLGAFTPSVEDEPPAPAGTELMRPQADSTDEEFIAFVLAARAVDLADFVRDNPELEDRVTEAFASVVDSRPPSPALSEGTTTNAEGLTTISPALEVAAGGNVTPTTSTAGGLAPDAFEVVKGSVDDVSTFLSQHPERAQEILAAETTVRGAEDKEPRAGVVRAVEAAAGTTG